MAFHLFFDGSMIESSSIVVGEELAMELENDQFHVMIAGEGNEEWRLVVGGRQEADSA